MLFSDTGSPSKHIEPDSEEPPNVLQKSFFDFHTSDNLEVELTGVPPCDPNGLFTKDAFWHLFQTFEQKSVKPCFDWDESAETVELQRTGTFRVTDSTV